jgi:tetratricopeptide (TPR) repeat protein
MCANRSNHVRDKDWLERGVLFLVFGLALLYWPSILPAEFQRTENGGAESFEQLADGASAALAANRIPEAIHLYQRATAVRPSWSEGWWYLGTLFFDSSQFSSARAAFEHFVSVERKQPGPGLGMLGLTEFRLNEYRNALTALERGRELGLGDNADFVQTALYHDGILNNFFGKPEIALVRLTLVANRIAATHPEGSKDAVLADTELLDALGLAALRIRKLPSEAPAERSGLIRRAGHAQALIALQDRVAAGDELKQLVAAYPSESGVHYFYGVYLLKEDHSSAIEEFRREIAVSPKHAAARIQLALEFLSSADYKQGLKYAQEAVALAPDDFVAHVACGKLWLQLGNSDRAVGELQTAVRLSPGSPDVHFALSRALSTAGRSREAAQQRTEFERLKALAGAADHD